MANMWCTPLLTVELCRPFRLYSCNNLVGVLRASGSLSYELRRVAVEFSVNDYAFVKLQGFIVRLIA